MTVPTSANPNPSAGQARSATPFLSIPAASPTAFGKSTPKTVRGRSPPAEQLPDSGQRGRALSQRREPGQGPVVGGLGVAVAEPEQHRPGPLPVAGVQDSHQRRTVTPER